MKASTVVLVGCGGTGSILVEPLARLLAHHPSSEGACLWLADGDLFEDRNAARQMGCAPGEPKASVALRRVQDIIPAYSVINYLSGPDILDLLPSSKDDAPGVIVVLAVDNHASRKALLQALHGYACESMLVLSPGNALDRGQVKAWARVYEHNITPYPLSVDGDGVALEPELLNPTDRIPEGGDCITPSDLPSAPQLITANMMAAACSLAVIQRWLDRPDGLVAYETGFEVSRDRTKVYSQ